MPPMHASSVLMAVLLLLMTATAAASISDGEESCREGPSCPEPHPPLPRGTEGEPTSLPTGFCAVPIWIGIHDYCLICAPDRVQFTSGDRCSDALMDLCSDRECLIVCIDCLGTELLDVDAGALDPRPHHASSCAAATDPFCWSGRPSCTRLADLLHEIPDRGPSWIPNGNGCSCPIGDAGCKTPDARP